MAMAMLLIFQGYEKIRWLIHTLTLPVIVYRNKHSFFDGTFVPLTGNIVSQTIANF